MSTQPNVEQEVLQCIDDGLKVLGTGGMKTVYDYLEQKGLKRNDIPKEPEKFCQELASMFGEEGAKIIQRWIVEKLRKMRFGSKHEADVPFLKIIEVSEKSTCQKK